VGNELKSMAVKQGEKDQAKSL